MIILGVTGPMAMGKSTVSKMLHQLFHIPIWDADQVVRELLQNDISLISEISKCYPQVMKEGKIDRLTLRSLAFENPDCLTTLETLIHARAFKEAVSFLNHMERTHVPICVLDVPLLFEVGWDKVCTHTLLVQAPLFIQLLRIQHRPDLNQAKIDHILSRFLPMNVKKKLATFTIQTGLSKHHTFKQLKNILQAL
jgi:dephospho-CoA kinase